MDLTPDRAAPRGIDCGFDRRFPTYLDVDDGLGSGDLPAADPTAPAADPAAPAPAPEPAAVGSDSWLSTLDPKVADHIRELREEAKGYRQKYAPFRDAFDGFEDPERDWLLNVAKSIKADPNSTAEQLQAVIDRIAEIDADDPGDPGTDAPLTRADLERFYEERKAEETRQAAERDAVAQIHSELKEAGYEPGSLEADLVMGVAVRDHQGDIAAAVAAVKALEEQRDKAAVEKFLASKKAGADLPSPPQPGPAPSGERVISSLADAHRAARARIYGGDQAIGA